MRVKDQIAKRYSVLKTELDERRWAGAEALAIGRGGITQVCRAMGMSRSTVRAGCDEAKGKKKRGEFVEVRRKGAGHPPITHQQPRLMEALDDLVDPATRGDPESPLRWTCLC